MDHHHGYHSLYLNGEIENSVKENLNDWSTLRWPLGQ